MIKIFYSHINPKDPAVIPTVTKNPNSTRSLEPGGSDVNSSASGIIEAQKIDRLCMQLLLLLLRKLFDTFFILLKDKLKLRYIQPLLNVRSNVLQISSNDGSNQSCA